MSGTSSLRYGVVGCAHYHAGFWLEGMRGLSGVVVEGAWDADTDRARAFAQQHGTEVVDLDRLLERCDVVGITSETADHPELVERAAAAGVHVVCEKPLALDVDGCRRIADAARAAGIMVLANLPKRFDPVNAELKRQLTAGELGDVHLVRVRHGHHHGLDEEFGRQWFTDPERAGGGTLFDEGIHAFDLLRWLFGDPETISAVTRSRLGLGVDDSAVATLEFPSGMIAQVSTSWAFLAGEASVEVYGTEGSALLGGVDLASRDMAREHLKSYTRSQPTREWRVAATGSTFVTPDFHAAGPRHLVSCIRDGTPLAVSVDDGMAAVAMVAAAYESARTGLPVTYRSPASAPGVATTTAGQPVR